jgi:hypothetical protein
MDGKSIKMPRKKKLNYEELHRELWNWIAENLPKGNMNYPLNAQTMTDIKMDWPGWEIYYKDYDTATNQCFACDDCDVECIKCPLTWGDLHQRNEEEDEDMDYDPPCESLKDSPYKQLLKTVKTRSTAVKLAQQIADMKWKHVK